MPSLFKRKQNPYSNPHHPSHNAIPKIKSAATTSASTSTTAAHTQSQPTIPPRPASPRGSSDFLAEARELAGRDPVTGRTRPAVLQNDSSNRSNQTTQTQTQTQSASNPHANAEMSAYLHRASQSPVTLGTRYDLFSQQCQAQRGAEQRLVNARGGVEYYAPERQVSEFYSGPVDWNESRGTGNGFWYDGGQRDGGSGFQSGGGWVPSGNGMNYAQRAKEERVDLQLRLP